MIYLQLFLNFLMIGALSFGGGYGMISLVRETVLRHGWLTEAEFLSFVAVSESTPGPLAINMATFIGSSQGGFPGALIATLGVVLPSFFIILLIAAVLKNLMKYAGVEAFLSGVRPCVVAEYDALHTGRHQNAGGWICAGREIDPCVCCFMGGAFCLEEADAKSPVAHRNDPVGGGTGNPVLGNIRISIVRCLRGILLLMTASEKCAGRFPINLSGAFCYKKPGTGKLMAPCARLQLLLEFRRYAIKLQRKKQLRWKQPQKKRPQKKRPRWKQPQKKNRSPLQQRKKRSPRPQQQQKCW